MTYTNKNRIETKRLILRRWVDADLKPMIEINQDPQVMEYFPQIQDVETTKHLIKEINTHFDDYGYSMYACERKDTSEFIGFIGLVNVSFEAHFTPAVEIGWRISSKHWGNGYAPEGALALVEYAFNSLKLSEVVAFTAIHNKKSVRVMEKIGMQHDTRDDFDHPKYDDREPLKRQLLYRINKDDYLKQHP